MGDREGSRVWPGNGRWQGCHWPLVPEHPSETSMDLFITSWKGSFICQSEPPLCGKHRDGSTAGSVLGEGGGRGGSRLEKRLMA